MGNKKWLGTRILMKENTKEDSEKQNCNFKHLHTKLILVQKFLFVFVLLFFDYFYFSYHFNYNLSPVCCFVVSVPY